MSTDPKKPKLQVWGPSVPHSYNCELLEENGLVCNCPKRHYCARCDDQHAPRYCPKTVLDDIVAHLTFKEKSLKRLINEILDSAEARRRFGCMDRHIKSRIAELAEKYGNLGMTRKKLFNLAKKELNRRWRRERRAAIKASGCRPYYARRF